MSATELDGVFGEMWSEGRAADKEFRFPLALALVIKPFALSLHDAVFSDSCVTWMGTAAGTGCCGLVMGASG